MSQSKTAAVTCLRCIGKVIIHEYQSIFFELALGWLLSSVILLSFDRGDFGFLPTEPSKFMFIAIRVGHG